MAQPSILIIVDLQKGFVTDASRGILSRIEKIQDEFDHVIFTQFYNPLVSPFRDILGYDKLSPGDPEGDLAIRAKKDSPIISRPHYSCVTAELRSHLTRLKASDVYLCGIATEACVLKTVMDLFEEGYRPWLIEDLCASDQNVKYHDMAIELIAKLINWKHIIKEADLRGKKKERKHG